MRTREMSNTIAGDAYQTLSPTPVPKESRAAGHYPESGYIPTAFNILKNIVNAGFLSLPIAMEQSSLIPGICVMVIVMCFNAYTFSLLGRLCEEHNVFSYRGLWEIAYGKQLGFVIDIMIFFFTLGGTVVIIILIGDFGNVLEDIATGIVATREFRQVLLTTVVLLPLSLLKDLHQLRFSSALGLCFILYCAIYLTTVPPQFEPGKEPQFIGFSIGLAQAIALWNTAYTCHYNAPRFYEEFKYRSPKLWTKLVYVLYIFIMFFYAWTAIVPYYIFGQDVQGNILNNFDPSGNNPVIAIRLGLMLSVCLSYPFPLHGMRWSVERLLFPEIIHANSMQLETRGANTTDKYNRIQRFCCPTYPNIRRCCLVILFVGVSLILGVVFDDISDVNALRGALIGMFLVYTLPAGMYLKLGVVSGHKRTFFDKVCCWLTIVFGLITGVIGTVAIFL